MGNTLSKIPLLFRRLFRRNALRGECRNLPGGRRPTFPVRSNDGPPAREHPAAPARPLRPALSHRARACGCLPASSHTQRRRACPLPQGRYAPVGSLRPAVNWKDPPKKIVRSLSSQLGLSGTVRIPPPVRNFTHPRFPREQVVNSLVPGPSRTTPQPGSREMKAKVQGKPHNGMAKRQEHHVETNGQDDQNSHYGSGDLRGPPRPPKAPGAVISDQGSAGPLDGGAKHPESSLSENAPEAPMSSPCESQVVESSGRPAGDAPPPPKPDSETAVLSAPAPCCSLLPERSTKDVQGENHAQIHPDSLRSGKAMHSDKPVDIPPGRVSSLASTSCRLGKRKMSMPVSLPLPRLVWDRGELPVPCKLPRLDPDALKNLTCQSKNIVEDKMTNASAKLTSQPTVTDSDVTDADTTPPSDVFVFTAPPCRYQRPRRRRPRATSPPCCWKKAHRHPRAYCRVANPPNSVDSSAGPPASKYLRLAPCHGGGPQSTPQPTSGTCGGRKRKTSVVRAAGSTKQPLESSAATHAPANSASANPVDDSEPMDTTPPP